MKNMISAISTKPIDDELSERLLEELDYDIGIKKFKSL